MESIISMTPSNIAERLRERPIGEIATAFIALGPEKAADVFALFTQGLKMSLVENLTLLGQVDENRIKETGEKLGIDLSDAATEPEKGENHGSDIRFVAAMLNHHDESDVTAILKALDEKDAEMTWALRSMTVFLRDLPGYEPIDIRTIANASGLEDFSTMLLSFSEGDRRAVLRKMHPAERTQIVENMRTFTSLASHDISSACRRLKHILLKLCDEGNIFPPVIQD